MLSDTAFSLLVESRLEEYFPGYACRIISASVRLNEDSATALAVRFSLVLEWSGRLSLKRLVDNYRPCGSAPQRTQLTYDAVATRQ